MGLKCVKAQDVEASDDDADADTKDQQHQDACVEQGENTAPTLVRSDSFQPDRPNFSMTKLVIVGKTGTGKSSSGNTILGKKTFFAATSSVSVTQKCRKETGQVAGREIMLVDTPGLFDTSIPEKELKQEICKCINMTSPGPHAIILVIQLGPFTEEERLSVEKIRTIFGEEADKYTMVLFTHGDGLTDQTIDEYVKSAHKDLRQVIEQCGGRYHVFDNTKIPNRAQVLEFLEKVDSMVAANGGEYYTSKKYHDVQKMLQEKEEELRKLYEQKLQEQKVELELKFNAEKRQLEETIEKLKESGQEKEKIIKELQSLENRHKLHVTEYERYYGVKLLGIKHEAEQTQFEGIVQDVITGFSKYLKLR